MHQSSPHWQPKSKKILVRGHSPLPRGHPLPTPHLTPPLSAHLAPRSSRLRRSIDLGACGASSSPSAPRFSRVRRSAFPFLFIYDSNTYIQKILRISLITLVLRPHSAGRAYNAPPDPLVGWDRRLQSCSFGFTVPSMAPPLTSTGTPKTTSTESVVEATSQSLCTFATDSHCTMKAYGSTIIS